MMLRKSCPRCHGDLFLDRNDGPAMWACLQCGRNFDARSMAAPADESREPVAIGAAKQERAA
jgi:ribosomal protein L37AE/L43A